MVEKRESFGSRLGAVMVAAGSAVGLGSIWRFPYIVGENGGGAFIMLYLISIFILGIPVMLAEFAIGTHTRKGPVEGYTHLSPRWRPLGYNSIIVSLLISGFYYVVAGWSLEYFVSSLDGSLYGGGVDFGERFLAFRASWREPFYTVLFVVLTHIVVLCGVKNGLERVSKVMMPALLIMLVILAICSAMLPGAIEGYKFMLYPDLSKALSVKTIMSAIGQAFFSLSIGIGCMIAYASYFKKGTNLTSTAMSVSLMTLGVALLSGIVIFPAVFSVGLQPTSGPSLIFETLPHVLGTLPCPALWSGVFFLLLSMAALTSTISFHEVLTVYFNEAHHCPRRWATVIASALSIALSLLCLNYGVVFEWFDRLTADVFMPIGGLFTALFAGWCFNRTAFRNEISLNGSLRARVFPVLTFLLKWVCPILIAVTFIYNLMPHE